MRGLRVVVTSVTLVLALALASSASASPSAASGAVIAFTEVRGGVAWISTVSPTAATPKVHRIGRGRYPSWLGDGTRLMFASRVVGVAGWFTSRPGGTNLRRIRCASCGTDAAPKDPGLVEARISPDGARAVARSYDSVVLLDISTGLGATPAFGPSVDVHEDCGAGCPSASSGAWSPDGTRIAFVRGDPGAIYDNGVQGQICVLTIETKKVRCITGSADAHPAWSPDGARIAFDRSFACSADGCRSEVRTVSANGGHSTLVIQDGAQPSWSPDGGRIAFVRVARPGACSSPLCFQGIATVKAAGGGMRILTTGAEDVFPAWQPG